MVKEPPYEISQSGYASFELPIEVYFRNKKEPKNMTFEYDLYLEMGRTVSNHLFEKLTFKNPSDDFRKRLLKGGGVG